MTQYFAGVDIGSTMTKVVIMNKGIISSIIGPTGPEQRRLANKLMEQALNEQLNLPELKKYHKLAIWFVGDVQGEERDLVYYSLVEDSKYGNADLRTI